MKFYHLLVLGIWIILGALHTTHAQQSINLMGLDYHHNITSNNKHPDFYNFKVQATVPISYSDAYFLSALPRYNQTYIQNFGLELPSKIFRRIDVPFIFQHKLSNHKCIGGIQSPGIHSDFKDISSEDWVFIAAVFMKNTPNPKFRYRYGLVFSSLITGMIIIPAVMFEWKPTDRITGDNNDPLSPEFSYSISEDVTTGMVLQRRGGTSKLTESFQNRNIKDVRYEMVSYIDYKIWDTFVLRGAAGYTFSRKLQVFEDINAGSTWYRSLIGRDTEGEKTYSGWFFTVGLEA